MGTGWLLLVVASGGGWVAELALAPAASLCIRLPLAPLLLVLPGSSPPPFHLLLGTASPGVLHRAGQLPGCSASAAAAAAAVGGEGVVHACGRWLGSRKYARAASICRHVHGEGGRHGWVCGQ